MERILRGFYQGSWWKANFHYQSAMDCNLVAEWDLQKSIVNFISSSSLLEFKDWLSESIPTAMKTAFKELKAGNSDSLVGVNKFMSSFKSSLVRLSKTLATKQWTKGWTHGSLVGC